MRGEQLSRQWKLIQLLAKARYGVVADSLAGELACNRRTVYRDLDALMFAGFPITSERRDGRVFYRVIDGFRLGDTPFTPDELLALGFSEDLLRVLEGTVFHDWHVEGLANVEAAARPGQAQRVRFRIDTPGRYTFECMVPGHAEHGMTGVLVVHPAA